MCNRLVPVILAVPLFAFTGGAAASSRADAAMDALIACLNIADAEERLSCLESAALSIKAARGEIEMAPARDKMIADEKARDDEAFAPAPYTHLDGKKNDKQLDAGVTNIRVGALKSITVSLDNGQIWRQLDGDRTKIGARKISGIRTVTIRKGAVGGYWMTLNEIDQQIRVKRIM